MTQSYPHFKSELWAKKERLVYKPKSRLLRAYLQFDIRKLDEQTAQISVSGEYRLPFQAAREIRWMSQLTNGEPAQDDLPEVFLLPILLRSFFSERTAGEFKFRIGGRPYLLSITTERERCGDVAQIRIAKLKNGAMDPSRTQKATLTWNCKEGVIDALDIEAPIFGKLRIELVEHSC